jgi:RNA polymerase sigma-70 factor (ECF subfamily)
MMQTEAQRAESDRRDRRLLAGIRQGNEEAFQDLFRSYYGRVQAFVLGRVSDAQLAQEIAGDVFFEVWRSAERFRGESRVSSWLFGIAHYRCLAALRERRAAKRSRVIPTGIEYLQAVPDSSQGPERIDSREELQMVMDEIERLPENYRAVAELALVEGLSHGEIADKLGIRPDNVRTRVSRARAQLRRRVGREWGN